MLNSNSRIIVNRVSNSTTFGNRNRNWPNRTIMFVSCNVVKSRRRTRSTTRTNNRIGNVRIIRVRSGRRIRIRIRCCRGDTTRSRW